MRDQEITVPTDILHQISGPEVGTSLLYLMWSCVDVIFISYIKSFTWVTLTLGKGEVSDISRTIGRRVSADVDT